MKNTINIELFKKYTPLLLILGFVIIKVQDLFLPYFWDEAWSYIPAIKEMALKGPSLMPNSISTELYRGHPLLFYFLSSTWMNIFGAEVWISKLFPLLATIILLLSVFTFTKKNFDYITAILTITVIMIQSVFFAQSTFLLPEILLAFFTFQSIRSFIEKRHIVTAMWLTLALYTKESAIVIWITLSFFGFIELLRTKNNGNFDKLKNVLILIIPLLLIFIFFSIQKRIVGWVFFPEHIEYLSIADFFDKLNGYASYLFIFMGRNILTIFGLIALLLLIIRKESLSREKKRIFLIFSVFIISYLLFSSLNFYSPRYLISILPFVILIWVYLIKTAVRKYNSYFLFLVFSIVIVNNLYFTINKRGGHDHTLGFRDLIYVQEDMISYCEDMKLYEKEIYTHFLMFNNLTNKDLGYLKRDNVFINVKTNLTSQTDFAIVSSNELNENKFEEIRGRGILIKRFEQKGCWTELYQFENH